MNPMARHFNMPQTRRKGIYVPSGRHMVYACTTHIGLNIYTTYRRSGWARKKKQNNKHTHTHTNTYEETNAELCETKGQVTTSSSQLKFVIILTTPLKRTFMLIMCWGIECILQNTAKYIIIAIWNGWPNDFTRWIPISSIDPRRC